MEEAHRIRQRRASERDRCRQRFGVRSSEYRQLERRVGEIENERARELNRKQEREREVLKERQLLISVAEGRDRGSVNERDLKRITERRQRERRREHEDDERLISEEEKRRQEEEKRQEVEKQNAMDVESKGGALLHSSGIKVGFELGVKRKRAVAEVAPTGPSGALLEDETEDDDEMSLYVAGGASLNCLRPLSCLFCISLPVASSRYSCSLCVSALSHSGDLARRSES